MNKKEESTEDSAEHTVVTFLNKYPLFGELDEDELKVILTHVNVFDFEAGKEVFREGEQGDCVCFVADGEMDVMKETPAGLSVRLATLVRGHSIGEMSIIDNTPRSATVLVKEKVKLITFSRKSFESISQSHPKIALKILRGMAHLLSMNLRKTSNQLIELMYPLY
jgi:CRP-like cAMP-binding protein